MLAAQVSVIAAAATALCCIGPGAAVDSHMACCKDGGHPHDACPLTKKAASGTPTMKSCCDPEQRALAALFGFTGIPRAPETIIAAPAVERVLPGASEQPLARVRPPDPPPPRV